MQEKVLFEFSTEANWPHTGWFGWLMNDPGGCGIKWHIERQLGGGGEVGVQAHLLRIQPFRSHSAEKKCTYLSTWAELSVFMTVCASEGCKRCDKGKQKAREGEILLVRVDFKNSIGTYRRLMPSCFHSQLYPPQEREPNVKLSKLCHHDLSSPVG